MALEELFVPNLPQMYKATAQLLRNCRSMEIHQHEGTGTALQFNRQVEAGHKKSIRLDAESKKNSRNEIFVKPKRIPAKSSLTS